MSIDCTAKKWYPPAMKRAFAITIVVVLALGMVGMFFPALVSGIN